MESPEPILKAKLKVLNAISSLKKAIIFAIILFMAICLYLMYYERNSAPTEFLFLVFSGGIVLIALLIIIVPLCQCK